VQIVVCNVSNRIKEGTGIGKYLETASDEEKRKWVEENVEVQRKDLLQARHQIPRLRQNSLREYFDYFAVISQLCSLSCNISRFSNRSMLMIDFGYGYTHYDGDLARYHFA
jgi:hypothetical protein